MITAEEKKLWSEALVLAEGSNIKVWWIPQVPGKPFEVYVRTLVQAKVILKTLAMYDLFQLANNIKPDFANAGGVSIKENNEWCDFDDSDFRYTYSENEEFDELNLEECAALDIKPYDKTY